VRRLVVFPAFFLVSLGGLGVALLGASYADSREQIRPEDLQRFYREINRESFDGKLPDVPVRWGDLMKSDAYGITHFERGVPYAMELDRETVRSKSFALDVIRHESCHIATNGEAKRRKEDPHGATFVACMARIQENQEGD
jgi:predicted SprT family Zn-dependent metalloprotease